MGNLFKGVDATILESIKKDGLSSEKKAFFEALDEECLNPLHYDAAANDYLPFLIQVAFNGQLRKYYELVSSHLDWVAYTFKPVSSAYVNEQFRKYEGAFGRTMTKTKMVLVGLMAINKEFDDEELSAMKAAFAEWQKQKDDERLADESKMKALSKMYDILPF